MKILVLAPHTDDGEIAMGGTIARHIEERDTVVYVAFTALDGENDLLREECKRATERLGIRNVDLIIWDFPVRRFSEERQKILNHLLALKDSFRPDRVYAPCLHDTHQDHQVVAMEAVRAFKDTTVLAYEMPRNNLNFNAQHFVTLTPDQLQAKIESVWMYDSQRTRTYTSHEYLEAHAHFRGVQIDKRWAEAFEVIRWVR